MRSDPLRVGGLEPELYIGNRDIFYLPAVFLFIFTFTFHLLAVPMHDQVLGLTLEHEFDIFNSHTERTLNSTHSVNGDGICKQRGVKLNFKLLLFYIFFSITCESFSFFIFLKKSFVSDRYTVYNLYLLFGYG